MKLYKVGVRQVGIQTIYVFAESEAEARYKVDNQVGPMLEGDDFPIVDVDDPDTWDVEEEDDTELEEMLREQEP